MNEVRFWDCQRWLNQKFALVILNQPLNKFQIEVISKLWISARIRVAVDGGCNRLHRTLPHLTPDLITGDLDSVDSEILREYQERGVDVVRTPDQDQTDFTKCLHVLAKRNPDLQTVITFCTTGGRLDQVMANVNTLYKSIDITKADVVLHAGDELSWVLRQGAHLIMTPKTVRGHYCGIIPVGAPAIVTSRGLKWNLTATRLAFQQLVSTSNCIVADEVFIETSKDVLWTMTLSS